MCRLVLIVLVAVCSVASADELPAAVRAQATRRSGPIDVDGHLDEAAWTAAVKQTGFVQRFPKDGAKATLDTSFAIVYDDEALYVGVWADDPEPARVNRLLTRRDVDIPAADAVTIGIDSYHDRRTAYVFQLNAAGVQRDMLVFDDQGTDDTWDAVWTGDAAVSDHGWTAEFRIPFNQLRFADETREWGLQVRRLVGRTAEETSWSPWPRSGPAVVSKFGIVEGIDHVKQGRRLELLPYVTGGFERMPVAAGDPLNDRYSLKRNLGLDLKYGLGPAFTLSATINPDFGQVEADPSQVNLSGNELFFAEKRPFFLEGVDLFKLPIGNGDNNVEGAFYSRRIGAAPQDVGTDYQYINAPKSTAIYGAMKLTGKTRGGWSIGVLDAVTAEETATIIDAAGTRSEPIVAPVTNYAVLRVKRDLRDGRTSVGISASAVDRALGDTPLVATLHDQAYTGGLQLQHRWADNAWQANISTLGSWIHGSTDAIAITQTQQRHLFQRPDSTDTVFDPTRTSLAGAGATWKVGRFGDTKHWRFLFGGDLRTPGLELNNLGFQLSSDRVVPYLWGQYRVDEPSANILNWQVNSDIFVVSTLEPDVTDIGLECTANLQLPSYWSFAAGCNLDNARNEPSSLRGGPWLKQDPRAQGWVNMATDTRRWIWFSVNLYGGRTPAQHEIDGGIDLGATIQARSNIDLYLGPSWFTRNDGMQYIDAPVDMTGRTHYILGRIKQTTASLTARLNWTFSPHLTLQVYAQPFIASGSYSELKDVNNPHADRFDDRFHVLGGGEYQVTDGTVFVDHDGVYSFSRPDFDFRQVRSTIVLRWEYRPGSTVFAIWSHGRTSTSDDGRFQLGHDLRALIDAPTENVVMVKANYWIGL